MNLFTYLCGLVFILLLFGWLFEKSAEQRDRKRCPPPGKLVDLSGHKLHIISLGESRLGQPTVVLESGDGLWSTCWRPVQQEMAKFSRVCAYDRPGFGWSEPYPGPCTLENIASNLHSLLKNAGEAGPFVLVGHSYGGMMIRQFAALYPQEVSGMVFVDAIHENYIRYMPEARKTVRAFQLALRMMQVLACFGLVRLLFRRLVLSRFKSIFPQPEDMALAAALTLRPQYFRRLLAENVAGNLAMDKGLPASANDIPVVVIHAHYPETPARGFTPERWKKFRESWMAMEKDLLSISTNARLVTFEGGHIVQNEHPEIIVDAVRQLIEALRGRDLANGVPLKPVTEI